MSIKEQLTKRGFFGQEISVDSRVIEAIFGDVSPENIARKTHEFLELRRRPGVSEVELDRWLLEKTAGIMEEMLVLVGTSFQDRSQSLRNTQNKLQNIRTLEESDEKLATLFREYAPSVIETLGELARLEDMQFSTLVEEIHSIRKMFLPEEVKR